MRDNTHLFVSLFLWIQHVEAETKWPPFFRRHFEIHSIEWKVWISVKTSLTVFPYKVIIGPEHKFDIQFTNGWSLHWPSQWWNPDLHLRLQQTWYWFSKKKVVRQELIHFDPLTPYGVTYLRHHHNGLLPRGNNPLPELLLSYHNKVQCHTSHGNISKIPKQFIAKINFKIILYVIQISL